MQVCSVCVQQDFLSLQWHGIDSPNSPVTSRLPRATVHFIVVWNNVPLNFVYVLNCCGVILQSCSIQIPSLFWRGNPFHNIFLAASGALVLLTKHRLPMLNFRCTLSKDAECPCSSTNAPAVVPQRSQPNVELTDDPKWAKACSASFYQHLFGQHPQPFLVLVFHLRIGQIRPRNPHLSWTGCCAQSHTSVCVCVCRQLPPLSSPPTPIFYGKKVFEEA